jgi:transcriptional regulator with XRE-family HTH domain
MNIDIGTSLRRLRRTKDITQEELAEFLGVSFQSVSKWERGDCYPDITMLPSLANFFEVSVDELMGMNEKRRDSYLGDTFRRAHEYEAENRYNEAIELLRQAIQTFPNNYGLLSELALALSFKNSETTDGMQSAKEAIVLCECVLANSTNEKIRSTTRANLCFLYRRIGERQRALDLVRTLPHVWESREILLPEMQEGHDVLDSLKKAISIVLSML